MGRVRGEELAYVMSDSTYIAILDADDVLVRSGKLRMADTSSASRIRVVDGGVFCGFVWMLYLWDTWFHRLSTEKMTLGRSDFLFATLTSYARSPVHHLSYK